MVEKTEVAADSAPSRSSGPAISVRRCSPVETSERSRERSHSAFASILRLRDTRRYVQVRTSVSLTVEPLLTCGNASNETTHEGTSRHTKTRLGR